MGQQDKAHAVCPAGDRNSQMWTVLEIADGRHGSGEEMLACIGAVILNTMRNLIALDSIAHFMHGMRHEIPESKARCQILRIWTRLTSGMTGA